MKATVETAAQTPSQQAVAATAQKFVVVDSTGRRITLKNPGILQQFKLVEALGNVADNRTYMRMALPLIYITDIDGEPVVTLMRKSEVDALIQRLGDHGYDALMTGMEEHFSKKSDEEADDEAIKK